MPEPDLLALFVARLEDAGVRHLVTGSVAATLYGEPRATHDIDLVVALSAAGRDALATAFPEEEFYVPPPEVVEAESERASRGHFNIIHHASGLKADIYLVGDDELHAWAFSRAHEYRIGDLAVHVAPPEYVIVRKLEFYSEGGSPKHLRDIRAMLDVSADLIDVATIADWVRKRGLIEAWAEAQNARD